MLGILTALGNIAVLIKRLWDAWSVRKDIQRGQEIQQSADLKAELQTCKAMNEADVSSAKGDELLDLERKGKA